MTQVHILMGVYEGAPYLEAQLQSLLHQSHKAWHLHVSDDSPTPASRDLIARILAGHGDQLSLGCGPRRGFAANYMHLLRNSDLAGGMLAFADQDDIWFPDKLARAVTMLAQHPGDLPALYCARSFYWDGGEGMRPSPAFPRAPSFRNALIENIAQGNTIVLNPAAAQLAQEAAQQVEAVFAHDWWLYQLIIGAGGAVLADQGPPVMRYRQHGGNALGSGQGLSAQIGRKLLVLAGGLTERLDMNDAALIACRPWLTQDTIAQHDAFMRARRAPLPQRLAQLYQLWPYRQRPLATLGFWGASLIGRA